VSVDNSDQPQGQSEKAKTKQPQRITRYLRAVLLFFVRIVSPIVNVAATVAIAYFAYHQWEAISGQLQVMQAQLTEMKAASDDTKRTIAAFEKIANTNAAANDFNRDSARAYIAVDAEIISSMTFGKEGTINIRFVLKNSGRSLADEVYIEPEIIFLLAGKERRDTLPEQKSTCDQARRKIKNPSAIIHSIGVGASETEDVPMKMKSEDIEAGKREFQDVGAFSRKITFIAPAIVGCVIYKSANDGKRKEATFFAWIARNDEILIQPDMGIIYADKLSVRSLSTANSP
jgi:hypothetical protein